MKMKIVCEVLLAAVAAAGMAGSTGCSEEVKSAVVAELPSTEKSEGEAGQDITTKDSGEGTHNSDAEMATVPEQVMAPEVCEADFTDYYEEPSGTGEESSRTQIAVSVNAPVLVPDVDSVCLKQAVRITGEESKEMFMKFPEILSQGAEIEADPAAKTGKVTVGDVPYRYDIMGTDEDERNPGFYWGFDAAKLAAKDKGFTNTDTGALILAEEEQDAAKAKEDADTVVSGLGLGDFVMSLEEKSAMDYRFSGEEIISKDMMEFYYERTVDGIPINYTYEPMYYAAGDDVHEAEGGAQSHWQQECLKVSNISGGLNVWYENPIKVSDYSDEKLFLLPFEEIMDIFENTIASKMMGPNGRWVKDLNQYTGSKDGAKVNVEIDRIKLGYMCIPDGDNANQGILTPVWDFYGTWGYELPEADIENDNSISLLTLDARDGTVVGR